MTNPRQRIETDLKQALKAGDKERLSTLRMLLTEINNERIRHGGEVDETGFVAVVRKAIKQRHEAAEQFRKGGREESAAKEEREAAVLGAYLPQQASDEEIRAAIVELCDAEDLTGKAAIGRLMQQMLARFGTRADGATVNRIAREVLTARDPS
ncbi:MAG TPA: GatB/YqeY domain-containing protein [Thermoanaerobaculia bacterium]|nr:GatB/YqeY domain-containing protein [Thermoanaerobaculia bacterium]